MKILLAVTEDFYSKLMLSQAVEALAGHDLSLALSKFRTKQKQSDFQVAWSLAKKTGWRLMFSQWVELIGFDWIAKFRRWVTGTDRVGNQLPLTPCHYYQSINSEEFIQFVKTNEFDVIYCLRQNEILKAPIIEAPRLGCINIHPAKLPAYPGIMTSFYTLLNGEKQSAVTFHQMTPKLDEGAILHQEFFDISDLRTLAEVHLRAHRVAGKGFVPALKALAALGGVPGAAPKRGAVLYTWPHRAEVEQFRSKGLQLMSWKTIREVALS